MDMTFVEGIAAVVSAVIVFCGSVWLLLSMVLGPRLAYFVTASVTLGFLLIMGVVWSLSPLGPVGTTPEWKPLAIGVEGQQLDAGPAEGYPDGGGWREVDTNDEGEITQAAELGSASTEFLEVAIDDASSETGFDKCSRRYGERRHGSLARGRRHALWRRHRWSLSRAPTETRRSRSSNTIPGTQPARRG